MDYQEAQKRISLIQNQWILKFLLQLSSIAQPSSSKTYTNYVDAIQIEDDVSKQSYTATPVFDDELRDGDKEDNIHNLIDCMYIILSLVAIGQFPLDNVAFLLFLDLQSGSTTLIHALYAMVIQVWNSFG